MNASDRIKYIRKSNNLTLEKFGERLGVGKSAISNIENGIRGITDQMVRSICREFNVNESWLRTGEGEPYVAFSKKEKISDFFGDVLKDDEASLRVKIAEVLADLTVDDWEYLADLYTRIKK